MMQQNLIINEVYTVINALPKKMQLSLVERFIFENDLLNDIIDINIAKQRLKETGTNYEEFRKKRNN
ncbi:MAG: hypothetical protein RO257_12965 [Candidatus Kapabacteria bacterium]|nr:hypothetical protein [Candidatus Kapabacteria bacterium]